MKPVIKRNAELLSFKCLGCKRDHSIQHGSDLDPNWGWNGSLTQPTFTPSVLVTYEGKDAGHNGAPPAVCHSFVTDGRIQFLGDCTHALAGQTVDLPEWSV
ncbi:MAG: DUF6527 family protein [Comamonas sp.]